MEISRKMWIGIVLASFLIGAGAAAGIGAVQLYRQSTAKTLGKPQQPVK
jgi:hypothetical protein